MMSESVRMNTQKILIKRQSRSRRDPRFIKNKQEKGKSDQSTKKSHQRSVFNEEKDKLRMKEETIAEIAKRHGGTRTQTPSDLADMVIREMSKSPILFIYLFIFFRFD